MYKYTKELLKLTDENLNHFHDKETYRIFRKIWSIEYMKLAAKIRTCKNAGKPYLYSYREKGDTSSKKKTIIGRNPNYDYSKYYDLNYLQPCAFQMLELLHEAKQKSWKLKQEQLETV